MVYKKSKIKLISNLFSASFGSFLIYLISSIFLKGIIPYILGSLIFVYMIYFFLFQDNIKFEIEESKLKYYENNRLKKVYELKGSFVSYSIKQSNYIDKIDLIINEDVIDCASLGINRFYEMYYEIENLTGIIKKIKVGGDKDEK